MSAVETVKKWRRENATAFSAAIFLVAIAVVKTILTKKLFKHVNTPVAYSILSCVATNVCMVPLFYLKRDTREGFAYLERAMIPKFALICVAIAIDLGCTNAGLALLSLALQQCIKATSPAATMLVESFYKGTRPHPVLFVVVICICFGPVLAQMGTSSWEGSLFGIAMIMTSVVGGAFKYVFCHAAIKEHRQKMGTLAFTFWVEIFVGLMLLPWAISNGEAYTLLTEPRPFGDWIFLWGTAAFGGVRIYSQFAFLAATSATTLAMSNLAIQALTITLGILLFGTPLTLYLGLGVAVTVLFSTAYTYLKLSKVLERPAVDVADAQRGEAGPLPEAELQMELQDAHRLAEKDVRELNSTTLMKRDSVESLSVNKG